MRKLSIVVAILTSVLIACSSNKDKDNSTEDYQSSTKSADSNSSGLTQDDANNDGTYSADVDYYNPNTGTSNTYTLDVKVENGQVVEIDFPNGGWLDGSHISPADIDSFGDATVEDDEGRSFNVHLKDYKS